MNQDMPTMEIASALVHLNELLPLRARQLALPPELQVMHRLVLTTLASLGRTPTRSEFGQRVPEEVIDAGLRELGAQDLVVLDSISGELVGAYPLTCEVTPHRIRISGNELYAMCALDAMSIAPMFVCEVQIDSHCHVSHTPIRIRMAGANYVISQTNTDAVIGIRWQMPSAVAAYSMCMQMVFLQNWTTAQAWQSSHTDTISLFDLNSAAAFGAAFFAPLLSQQTENALCG